MTDLAGSKNKKLITEAEKREAEKNDGIEAVNVVFSQDEGVIVGYTYKRATDEIKKKTRGELRTVCYTPALKVPASFDFGIAGMGKINGLLLEYENK